MVISSTVLLLTSLGASRSEPTGVVTDREGPGFPLDPATPNTSPLAMGIALSWYSGEKSPPNAGPFRVLKSISKLREG